MNKKLNTPIVKAAIIILVCIIFISFGLVSRSSGFFENLSMLFSAFFSTITFIIGITIAILLSLVILIGLFLGATAIHSPEKARNLFKKFWSSAQDFTEIIKNQFLKKVDDIEHSEKVKEGRDYLSKQVHELSEKMNQLTEKVKSSHLVTAVQDRKKEGKNPKGEQTSTDLEAKVEALSTEMSDLRRNLQQLQNIVEQQSTSQEQAAGDLTDDLPPAMHILRYANNDKDKTTFTEHVNETVHQGLSFAQSHQYLLDKLPAHLKTLVEEHPRLTKDYIRHQRNELS